MSYSALLRDPRWQRKRLEIMRRANFRCEDCGSDRRTLNVHHERYDGLPWESPGDALACLCEGCHERRHALSRLGPETAEELQLEEQIEAMHELIVTAQDRQSRVEAARYLGVLIGQRSERRVARMEIERGLA